MNKALYLAIGSVLGAVAGSITTYFVVKGRFGAERDEAIEEYADHCEERITRYKEENEDLKNKLGVIEDPVIKRSEDHGRYEWDSEDEDADERKINNNEGVKKYHHYDGQELPEYASKRVFKKIESKPEEREKKIVNEITEEEFLDRSNDYEKQTIDILLRYGEDDDSFDAYWGYQTDNQMTCKAKFGKDFEEIFGNDIIGNLIDESTRSDEGVAILYYRNEELNTDFELVMHSDENIYYNKES